MVGDDLAARFAVGRDVDPIDEFVARGFRFDSEERRVVDEVEVRREETGERSVSEYPES